MEKKSPAARGTGQFKSNAELFESLMDQNERHHDERRGWYHQQIHQINNRNRFSLLIPVMIIRGAVEISILAVLILIFAWK